MQAEIEVALTAFRNSPQLTDDQMYWVLVSKGIERQLAARLVEFLPAAYCRVMLEPTGVRFPDMYQRPTGAPVPLASEPV